MSAFTLVVSLFETRRFSKERVASASSYTLARLRRRGYLCFNWKNLCTAREAPQTREREKRTADKLSGEKGAAYSVVFSFRVCHRELMASLLVSLSYSLSCFVSIGWVKGKKRGQLHCGTRGARLISQLREPSKRVRLVALPAALFHCESIVLSSVSR